MNKRNAGITWIELLAAIIIIVVLAMIFIPADGLRCGPSEALRRSACQSTLMRWGQAFSMYADEDPEQKFPPIQMVNRIEDAGGT